MAMSVAYSSATDSRDYTGAAVKKPTVSSQKIGKERKLNNVSSSFSDLTFVHHQMAAGTLQTQSTCR